VGELPDVGLYRRATAAAFVVAPALLLIDNILHPKEFARGHELEQVREIAEHATRWQVAHLLGFVAIVLFAVAVLGTAFLVRRRQPRLGLVAGSMALAGLLGLAAVLSVDGYTWGTVGAQATNPDVGPRAAAAVLGEVQESSWSLPYYLTPVAFLLGMAALAVGAARQGAVPAWTAGLLVVATLMTATETAIASNAYFIAGAAVLLAGGTAFAAAVWRMTDAEFAAGGP
jgi:hypothetical protein